MIHVNEEPKAFNPETIRILGSALDDALAAPRGRGSLEWECRCRTHGTC
jgi:hypothetical protein